MFEIPYQKGKGMMLYHPSLCLVVCTMAFCSNNCSLSETLVNFTTKEKKSFQGSNRGIIFNNEVTILKSLPYEKALYDYLLHLFD